MCARTELALPTARYVSTRSQAHVQLLGSYKVRASRSFAEGVQLRMHTCAHRSCKQFLKHGPPQKGANKPKLISRA